MATSNVLVPRPVPSALVFVGGALGTAARYGLAEAFPAVSGVPYTVFAINLLGALLLGALVEGLAVRGPDEGRLLRLRLLLGTGFMGGFTTYSALATDAALLLRGGATALAVGYGVATVVCGALATLAGIALAGRSRRRRTGGGA